MSTQEPIRPSVEREKAEKKAGDEAKPRRTFSASQAAASDPLAKDEKKRSKWATDLHTELESTYQMLGTVALFASRGDEFKAAAAVNVINTSSAAADAWVELAEKNPKVRQALEKFVSGTAAAQLLSIHFSMLAPMLSAYGLIPSNFGQMILMGSAMEQQSQNGNVG